MILLFVISLASCSGAGKDKDKICGCYNMFLQEVSDKAIDLEGTSISSELQSVYDALVKNNEDFKACDQSNFSRGKMGMTCMMVGDDCVDCEKLMRIAEKGPMIYYSMDF